MLGGGGLRGVGGGGIGVGGVGGLVLVLILVWVLGLDWAATMGEVDREELYSDFRYVNCTGMGTGTILLTCQKPVPIMVM